MSGRARVFLAFVLCVASAGVVSCAHPGPDTCGGYSVERQWDKRFRVTVSVKATEAPQWKLDEDGNPSPASFVDDSVEQAQTLFARVARQRCLELAFRESSGDAPLEWRAQKDVTSVSTCREPGAPGKRYYAIRIWGDRIICQYVHYL